MYSGPISAAEQNHFQELATEVAELPSGIGAEGETAKRFDLLLLTLQLSVLRRGPRFTPLRQKRIRAAAVAA